MSTYISLRILKVASVFFYSVLFLFLAFSPWSVRAETHITDDILVNGDLWRASRSPYILETDVYVPQGFSLAIEPGVIVISGTSTSPDPKSIFIDGDFASYGVENKPVRIEGIDGIFLENANVTMTHTYLDLPHGLTLTRSTSTFDHVVFKNANTALALRGSVADITSSEFTNNRVGIQSYKLLKGPVLMRANNSSETSDLVDGSVGVGGVGNAIEPVDPTQNRISVENSSFEGNTDYAISNDTVNTIDARNNWWGSADGPVLTRDKTVKGNTIYGPALAHPWKPEKVQVAMCCSNVLFIPGLQASRLYMNDSWSVNKLWEPNRNDDVRKLISASSTVFTKDVVDSVFGYGVYKKFVSMMETMVADGSIHEWRAFPYDWRKSVEEVALGSVQYSTSTEVLIDTVLSLASTSPTKKVSVVAHSNGGLVTKVLAKALSDRGFPDLLDKVVFVAVPQLGTPQAIAGLLHGDNQSILGGLILSKGVARALGVSMPGAYSLIPSIEYFKKAFTPVVTFASSTFRSVDVSSYGSAVTSYNSMMDYLKGVFDHRSQPSQSDTTSPSILSSGFLGIAERIHSLIDTWAFSSSTKVFTIAGWGKKTTETVSYESNKSGHGDTMIPKKTDFGDGTVVLESAEGSTSTDLVYVDQKAVSEAIGGSVEHANMLEAEPVLNAIREDLLATSTLPTSSLPHGLSRTRPDVSRHSFMVVGVHSPVDIDVYDSSGGHLGIVPNPDPNSDLLKLENTISGAEYETFGDEKYVYLDIDQEYSVKLTGTGIGIMTYTIDQQIGDTYVASTTFADIPVTPLFIASTTLTALIPQQVIDSAEDPLVLTMASTSMELALDVNGDGKVDVETKPNSKLDPLLHLESMRVIIKSLELRPKTERELLQRIDRVVSLIQKGKLKKAEDRIRKLVKNISKKHWSKKSLSEANRDLIVSEFETVLAGLE